MVSEGSRGASPGETATGSTYRARGRRGKAAVSWTEINEGDSAWVTRTRFSRGILESAVKLQSAAQSAAKFTMRTGSTGGKGWRRRAERNGLQEIPEYVHYCVTTVCYGALDISPFASSDSQTSFTFNPRERSLIGFIGRRQPLGMMLESRKSNSTTLFFPSKILDENYLD